GVCNARASGGTATRSWLGSARRLPNRNLAEKQGPDMVIGRICLADGSIALMRAGRISMVPALAAAVPAVGLDGADHHLDSQHHPNLLRLAFAHAWSPVVGSWLDHPARIRIRGSGRRNYRIATARTTGGNSNIMPGQPDKVDGWRG